MAFSDNDPTVIGADIRTFGDSVINDVQRLNRKSRDRAFSRADVADVTELQAAVDAMGASAVPVFTASGFFARVAKVARLASQDAGVWQRAKDALHDYLLTETTQAEIDTDSDIAPPVEWTVEPGRSPQPIVFDPNATYPGA